MCNPLKIFVIHLNLLAREIFLFPSENHFEGPEGFSSTLYVCGHPSICCSGHLDRGEVCCFFTSYFCRKLHSILHGKGLENSLTVTSIPCAIVDN